MAKDSKVTWISFALGTAGILVTIAGIYELRRSSQAATAPAPAAFQQPDIAQSDEIERLRAENRLLKVDAAREKHQAFLQERNKTAKCVGGVLFREVDGELRNVGSC